jgi:hypothetical protein
MEHHVARGHAVDEAQAGRREGNAEIEEEPLAQLVNGPADAGPLDLVPPEAVVDKRLEIGGYLDRPGRDNRDKARGLVPGQVGCRRGRCRGVGLLAGDMGDQTAAGILSRRA